MSISHSPFLGWNCFSDLWAYFLMLPKCSNFEVVWCWAIYTLTKRIHRKDKVPCLTAEFLSYIYISDVPVRVSQLQPCYLRLWLPSLSKNDSPVKFVESLAYEFTPCKRFLYYWHVAWIQLHCEPWILIGYVVPHCNLPYLKNALKQ